LGAKSNSENLARVMNSADQIGTLLSAPFVVGILCGPVLFKQKKKKIFLVPQDPKMKFLVACSCLILAAILNFVVVFRKFRIIAKTRTKKLKFNQSFVYLQIANELISLQFADL
jgi:hypothetical protein